MELEIHPLTEQRWPLVLLLQLLEGPPRTRFATLCQVTRAQDALRAHHHRPVQFPKPEVRGSRSTKVGKRLASEARTRILSGAPGKVLRSSGLRARLHANPLGGARDVRAIQPLTGVDIPEIKREPPPA